MISIIIDWILSHLTKLSSYWSSLSFPQSGNHIACKLNTVYIPQTVQMFCCALLCCGDIYLWFLWFISLTTCFYILFILFTSLAPNNMWYCPCARDITLNKMPKISYLDAPNPKTWMFLVSACSCLCAIFWNQVSSWEWKCSWSSAVRQCPKYVWVIINLIAFLSAFYVRHLTVGKICCNLIATKHCKPWQC